MKVVVANKRDEWGQFRAIEVRLQKEMGYYLSLLQLTRKTGTGDRQMADICRQVFSAIKQNA